MALSLDLFQILLIRALRKTHTYTHCTLEQCFSDSGPRTTGGPWLDTRWSAKLSIKYL